MAPVWRVGRSLGGVRGAVYATRLASVFVTALGVLVAWALARRLFPRRPEVWLAAAAVLAVAAGASANTAAMSNEALVIPLAGLALLPIAARFGGDGALTRRRALATGALVGVAVVTKSTCLALVPMIVLAVVMVAVRRRTQWREPVVFLAWTALVGALVLAPWLAWNLHAYGSVSAAAAVDAITGPLHSVREFSAGGINGLRRMATLGYWDVSLGSRPDNPKVLAIFGAAALLGAIAVARRVRSNDTREAAALAWLATAFPLVFALVVAVIFVTFDGRSATIGRHMYPSLVAMAVLLAAGAVLVFGKRIGFVALAALAVLSTWNEVESVDRYIERDLRDAAVPVARARATYPSPMGSAEGRRSRFVLRAPPRPWASRSPRIRHRRCWSALARPLPRFVPIYADFAVGHGAVRGAVQAAVADASSRYAWSSRHQPRSARRVIGHSPKPGASSATRTRGAVRADLHARSPAAAQPIGRIRLASPVAGSGVAGSGGRRRRRSPGTTSSTARTRRVTSATLRPVSSAPLR